MDITNILKDKIMLAVEKLENQSVLPKDLKKDSITVEKPKDESFGELSTNVSMVLEKQANIKPRNLGEITRISGVTPSAVVNILRFINKNKNSSLKKISG